MVWPIPCFLTHKPSVMAPAPKVGVSTPDLLVQQTYIMKKTALILAALLTGASLSADESASASYSVTVDFPYATKYVFRGVEYAEDVIQPSVKLTSGDFYAGIWSSLPLDKGYEAEVDYYAGYGFKLSDSVSLDLGATVYHYPGLDGAGVDKSTFEAYAGVNGSVGGVTLGLYLYQDFDLEVFTVQGNLGYSIPIDDKVSMNVTASIGNANPDAGSGYTYYSLAAQFPYKLSDKLTLTGGVNWASHDLTGVDDNHVWANAGLTYAF
jgi:uncharacterized protein (TIGR02001 family)